MLASLSVGDWVGIIIALAPVIGSQIISIIKAIQAGNQAQANHAAIADVATDLSAVAAKVTAVHQEVRPPSNGTTNGALLEGLAMSNRTQVGMLGEALGVKPPDVPPIPAVNPPDRPEESPFSVTPPPPTTPPTAPPAQPAN